MDKNDRPITVSTAAVSAIVEEHKWTALQVEQIKAYGEYQAK